MRMFLHELVISCKHSQEVLPLSRFNYFHGRMGAGKSTIARLIDFCLGGDLAYTPALQAQFVSATIFLDVETCALRLTRNSNESQIRAQWGIEPELFDILVPARRPDGEVLPGTAVENLSDLLFYLAGVTSPKVRRSKLRDDSDLVRLSMRDLLWYCYLDQDSMDSSFFRLDDSNHNIRLKSIDVLGLVIGFHQQRLSQLQIDLETVRNERLTQEAAAKAIRDVLEKENIASADDIAKAISAAKDSATTLSTEIGQLRTGLQEAATHANEALREKCRLLAKELSDIDESIREIETAIGGDKAHRNTLLALAVRQRRAQGAREALGGVEFSDCPRCYLPLPIRSLDVCALCGQVHSEVPTSAIDDNTMDADVLARTDELESKIELQTNALLRLRRQRTEISEEKQSQDLELNKASKAYDSAYLSQVLEREKRLARVGQRIKDLGQLLKLANRVGDMEDEAARAGLKEAEIRAEIRRVREKAERDTTNLKRLEQLFLQCLLRAKIPGFFDDDVVAMQPPTYLPDVLGKNTGAFAVTSFSTLGSGGKKTLFKCCFALAVHLLAKEQGVPLPSLLILDSPMKNISERENLEQFVGFNQMLYELSSHELEDTQFIVIDKEYTPPPSHLAIEVSERYMNPDDPANPPLLRRYSGK
jgi:hypothetical protein